MNTKHTKRGWKQDRQRVSVQYHELDGYRDRWCKRGTTIAQMREVHAKCTQPAMSDEFKAALEAAGLVYHDSTDGHDKSSPGHENLPETPSENTADGNE